MVNNVFLEKMILKNAVNGLFNVIFKLIFRKSVIEREIFTFCDSLCRKVGKKAMSKYASLKDFLSINHMDVISQALLNFMRDGSTDDADSTIAELTLKTLAWKAFDYGILTMVVGIEAKISLAGSNHAYFHYYNMTLHGHVLKRLSDLCVDGIEEVPETLLQRETAMSGFGLPNIQRAQLEDRAEELYAALCNGIEIADDKKYALPVVKIKDKYQMKLWPADLPDNCFGRLYLRGATVTIYDPLHIDQPYDNEPIPPGTILLNRRYYVNELIPDDIVTAAHELVHWSLHQVYFLVMQLLDDRFDAMNCTSEPMLLDDSMTMQEKAYFYAEWQANELSVRVAMPKHLVEAAVSEYENSHSQLHHDGDYYESMLHSLAWGFNVPPVIMKERFRQLGYDFADGVFVTVDGAIYQPFSFARGSLEANDTFVVDRWHYEQMLREDEVFAELMTSMRYIYTGYVVCLFDAKYLKPVNHDEGSGFVLTDYGSEHVDECCLRFERSNPVSVSRGTETNENFYFCRLYTAEEYGKADADGYYVLTAALRNDLEAFMGEHYLILEEMNRKGIVTLHKALHYHKDRKKLTFDQIVKRSGLSREVIDSYFAKPESSKHRNIPLERVMILCNVLELEETIALDLLKRAQFALNEYERKGQYYRYLLSITNAPLEVWNKILIEGGLEPLLKK